MFEEILVEKQLASHPRTEKILQAHPDAETIWIDRYERVFGQVKKPYLQKRESLRLIVAEKRGELVKPAPAAYGLAGEPHFYFVHAYNCIYECEYCYLQGYFHSPDIVVFVNHEQIVKAMQEKLVSHPNAWFHAGEFSDSLALSHLTGELEDFWPFFEKNQNAKLELRTKSANLRTLRKLRPLPNVVVSLSLAPAEIIEELEHKTARYPQRLKALSELQNLGFNVGLHMDPILVRANLEMSYGRLLEDLARVIDVTRVQYVSLGVVRFTKEVYSQVRRNYPDSTMWDQEFVTSFDKKVRYSRPQRMAVLQSIKQLCLQAGFAESAVYLCMEN